MACVKGVPSSHRACVARVGRKTRRFDVYAKPWRQQWMGWYRIPDASGQFHAPTMPTARRVERRWMGNGIYLSRAASVAGARFDGPFLWRDRQTLIHPPRPGGS